MTGLTLSEFVEGLKVPVILKRERAYGVVIGRRRLAEFTDWCREYAPSVADVLEYGDKRPLGVRIMIMNSQPDVFFALTKSEYVEFAYYRGFDATDISDPEWAATRRMDTEMSKSDKLVSLEAENPVHVWRDDGERFTRNEDGKYSMDSSEMGQPHAYTLERLLGTGKFSTIVPWPRRVNSGETPTPASTSSEASKPVLLRQAELTMLGLPTTFGETCARLWEAFNLGREYERKEDK